MDACITLLTHRNDMRARNLVFAFDVPQLLNAVMQTTVKRMAPFLKTKEQELASENGLDISELEEATEMFKKNFKYFLAKKIEKICKTVISHGRYKYCLLKIVLIRDCSRKYNWRTLMIDNKLDDVETPYKRIRNTRKRRFSTEEGVLEINVPPLLIMINQVIEAFVKTDLIYYANDPQVNIFRIQIQNEEITRVDGTTIKVGVEADDIIAIMCQRINREKAYLIAISNDMDFSQLLDRFAHFQLYNIRGTHQTLGYNSRLVPHLIALKGKRSSGLKSLLKPIDITRIKKDINNGVIRRVSDLENRLTSLIRNPATNYKKILLDDLKYSLQCVSFQEINSRIKSLIVHRLDKLPGLI